MAAFFPLGRMDNGIQYFYMTDETGDALTYLTSSPLALQPIEEAVDPAASTLFRALECTENCGIVSQFGRRINNSGLPEQPGRSQQQSNGSHRLDLTSQPERHRTLTTV